MAKQANAVIATDAQSSPIPPATSSRKAVIPDTAARERYALARRLDGTLPERVLRPIRLRALSDMLDARAGR